MKIGGEDIRRVEGAKFLGVWVDEGLKWTGQIEKVRSKVGRLVGVLGRAREALGGEAVHQLYNALVLPHLQYCLLVWGDFEEGRNKTLGEALLKYQKRFLGLITGARGRYHSDPLFSKLGILKINDLYRQQLRVHAWKFSKGRLPENQRNMLNKVSDVHQYNTRAARTGLFVSTQDHRSVGYRIPKEWDSLPEGLRGTNSLGGLKRKCKQGFLSAYKSFQCRVQNCLICANRE